jgi:hypothetical protein
VAVDDREQAFGQPGAGEDARDPLAAQRHVGRGLEHHAVAGHERTATSPSGVANGSVGGPRTPTTPSGS